MATLGDDVAPEEALWERLRGLVDRDADGRLRFRNTLVHAAAYEGLPFRRRRELHGRVGLVLESRLGGDSGDEAGVLAAHFFHAGDRERAWRYSRLCRRPGEGDLRQRRRRELLHAGAATPRGGSAARPAPRSPPWRSRWGTCATGSASSKRPATPTGSRCGTLRGPRRRSPPSAQAGADPVASRPLPAGPRPGYARHSASSRASRIAAAVRERANLFARKAVIRQRQGQPLEAIEWCRRTIEVAEAPGAQEALAQAQYVLDWAYATLGRFDEAVYSERALAIYEELGNLERQGAILNNLGAIAYYQAKWTEAVGFYERARTGLGAVGRPLVGVLRRRQPGRSPARPGTAGRGRTADTGVVANRESVEIRPSHRGDGPVPRHPARASRPVRRGASPARRGARRVRARRRVE